MMKQLLPALILSSILYQSSVYGQCRNLSFEEGIKKNMLSAELFNTAITSVFLACPQFSQGDSSLCGVVKSSRDKWDINLPDGLIFTALFEPVHYSVCKDVFQDAFFIESIKNIPEPSQEALEWFDERNKYHNTLISNENETIDSLDFVQKKMITVMHHIKSWTFCPEENATDLFIIHGSFDINNNIVIYNTACKAGKIYDADIKTMALVFRLFFVCSHELSHAVDKVSGISLNTAELREKAEKRANVNGLIFTLALSKLMHQGFLEYKNAIERTSNKAPCDEYYINQVVKQSSKLNKYFSNKIDEAKRVFEKEISVLSVSTKNPNWTINACLESQENHTTIKK